MVCVIEFTSVTEIEVKVKINSNKKRILQRRIKQTIRNKKESKWNFISMNMKTLSEIQVKYKCTEE